MVREGRGLGRGKEEVAIHSSIHDEFNSPHSAISDSLKCLGLSGILEGKLLDLLWAFPPARLEYLLLPSLLLSTDVPLPILLVLFI